MKKYRGTVPDEDILWLLLRNEFISDKDLRLFAVWCAREVLKLVKNPDIRSIEACNVAERYANGEATKEELYSAREAKAKATWAAIWVVAREAASEAVREAALVVAREAARAASAAASAACEAALAASGAASAAACEAAWTGAEEAARTVWVATGESARENQLEYLINN